MEGDDHCTMPILGFTMVFYSIMNLFHLDFLPKQMMDISYLGFLPFNINGSFIFAYIFFGAIQEELIRYGKKSWVQLLTLSIMMLPASMMSVTPSGDINVNLTVLGLSPSAIAAGYTARHAAPSFSSCFISYPIWFPSI